VFVGVQAAVNSRAIAESAMRAQAPGVDRARGARVRGVDGLLWVMRVITLT
jgi:hypothetical protein